MEKKPTYQELEKRVKELEALLEKGDEGLKWDIVTLLAREWDKNGPPGIIDNKDLVRMLDAAVPLVEEALRGLASDGITSNDNMGFATYLTPEGYEIAKKGDRGTPLAKQFRQL